MKKILKGLVFAAISTLFTGLLINAKPNSKIVKAEEDNLVYSASELYKCINNKNQTIVSLDNENGYISLTTDAINPNDPYIYLNGNNYQFVNTALLADSVEFRVKIPDLTSLSDGSYSSNLYYFHSDDSHGRVQSNMSKTTDWQTVSFDVSSISDIISFRLDYFAFIPEGNVAQLYIESVKFVGVSNVPDISDGSFRYTAVSGGSTQLVSNESAKELSLPAGYKDSLLKFIPSSSSVNMSVDFDFSNGRYNVSDINSITFRVLAIGEANSKYPEFRVQSSTDSGTWRFNGAGVFSGAGGYSLSTVVGTWHDIVISSAGFINNTTWNTFASSSNPDILGKLRIILRSNLSTSLYIDSITVDCFDKVDSFAEGMFTVRSSNFNIYKTEEASELGLQTGTRDTIAKFGGNTAASATLDFSKANIKLCLIDSIVFKVYTVASPSTSKPKYPELRFQTDSQYKTEWEVNSKNSEDKGDGGYSLANHLNQWFDVVVNKETITNSHKWSTFENANDPSILGAMTVMFRCFSTTDYMMIDSIKVNLKENDGVAPVINYSGETTLTYHAYQNIDIPVTAYDAQEERNVELIYEFDDEAIIVGNAITNIGTFTLVIKASDCYGNTSTITFTIIVIEKDEEAPKLNAPSTIKVKAGTLISSLMLEERMSDNSNDFTYIITFSDGTYDRTYRLLEGNHTISIYMVDGSGNIATYTINLIVTTNFIDDRTVIDEDEDAILINFFIDNYLHMSDYTESLGYCNDTEHHYYQSAKEFYENCLSDRARKLFNTDDKYSDARARLEAWANANGSTISNATNHIVYINNLYNHSSNLLLIIIVSISALCLSFVLIIFKLMSRKNK